MALDYIELGPVPAGEPCAQVGTENYLAKSLRECKVYQRMLERLCPIPQGLPVAFVVRSHPHDFGPYREVSVRCCGGNQAAVGLLSLAASTPRRARPVGHDRPRRASPATLAWPSSWLATRCPTRR